MVKIKRLSMFLEGRLILSFADFNCRGRYMSTIASPCYDVKDVYRQDTEKNGAQRRDD